MQYCYKCCQILPEELFTKSKRGTSSAICGACQRAYSRAYYERNKERLLARSAEYQRIHRDQGRNYGRKWREQHPDRAIDVQRRYNERHPGRRQEIKRRYYEKHKDKIQESARESYRRNLSYYRDWYQRNRDRQLELSAARYERDKTRITARARAHYRANKLAYRKYYTKRRALKRSAAVGHVDYPAIWERDQGICYLCGLPVERADLHFDHVIPLSKGGAHSMDNIRVTHETCNKRKGAKLVLESSD